MNRAGAAARGRRFIYVPWIAAHGDWLIERIAAEGHGFESLRLFEPGDDAGRRELLSLAARRPAAIERAAAARLARLGGTADGLVLTHDWPGPMRAVARAAAAAGLRTVLVPHESVYFARDRFYRDARGPADAPVCDAILAWGALQRDLFVARGTPPERIQLVGSPKLDAAAAYAPAEGREALRRRLGLDPRRSLVLFAMQPMDNALDPPAARRAQDAAMADLAGICAAAGAALAIKPPPARPEGPPRLPAGAQAIGVGPDAPAALDLLAAADLVVSVGSTMLIEAYLMRRPTLQVDYDPAATGAELRLAPEMAGDRDALAAAAPRLLAAPFRPDAALSAFVDRAFSPGRGIDGRSAARIAAALDALARPVALDPARRRGADRLSLFRRMRRWGAPLWLAAGVA